VDAQNGRGNGRDRAAVLPTASEAREAKVRRKDISAILIIKSLSGEALLSRSQFAFEQSFITVAPRL
jgi:hypothetical protein